LDVEELGSTSDSKPRSEVAMVIGRRLRSRIRQNPPSRRDDRPWKSSWGGCGKRALGRIPHPGRS
jgi:hypothetical protein